jgi:hypothetical protein
MDLYLIYIIISIIIIVGLVIFISVWTTIKRPFYIKVDGKTIWLLCLNGWDRTSYITRQAKDSWKKHNYSWNIELLSEENISNYIQLPSFIIAKRKQNQINDQDMYDIIQLAILSSQGGVWANSNILCMRPLDDWIFDCMSPTGIWMFQNTSQGIDSTFIACLKNNYIIENWYQKVLEHWKSNNKMDVWKQTLFFNLMTQNERFSTIWKYTPVLNQDATKIVIKNGSNNQVSKNVKRIFTTQCPYIVELIEEEVKADSNAYYAIEYTMKLKKDFKKYIPIPSIITVPTNLLPLLVSSVEVQQPSDTLIVISDCDDKNGINTIINLLKEKNDQSNVICYDKCNFGKNIPRQWIAKTFRNVGREQHTWLHFIILQYDSLPNSIIFMSSSVHKHSRLVYFKYMLENPYPVCGSRDNERNPNFGLDVYDGVPIPKAKVRPFSKWYSKYVKPWDQNGSKACWNGWARVSKEHILKRPKEFYRQIMVQLEKTNTSEEVHYMERSMADVFNL